MVFWFLINYPSAIRVTKVFPGAFLCTVVKAETDLKTRELIAGKMQSSQAAVDQQKISERMKHMADIIISRAQRHEQPNFREAIASMYVKGGFVASRESQVYSTSCIALRKHIR